MIQDTVKATENRVAYLDSIRGIAALSVVIFHSNVWLDFTKDPFFRSSLPSHILNMFFNGHNAVSLFFVLSGFVLSFKYLSKKIEQVSYIEFIIKRFFRLYPAYWFVLILVAIYTKTNFSTFFSEIPLLITTNHTLIPPAWSLIVEMKMSLVFLFFLVLAVRNLKLLFLMAFLHWLLFGFELYVVHFCIGIALAYYFEYIKAIQWNKPKRYLLFFIGFVLCSFKQIHFAIVPHENFKDTNTQFAFLLSAFGCAIWLILAMSAPSFQRKLESKALLFLGNISYGLYVGHWFIFINILEPHFNLFLSWIGSYYLTHFLIRFVVMISLSVLFATFLYYFVEKPFIKIGYKIAQKFKNKFVVRL